MQEKIVPFEKERLLETSVETNFANNMTILPLCIIYVPLYVYIIDLHFSTSPPTGIVSVAGSVFILTVSVVSLLVTMLHL